MAFRSSSGEREYQSLVDQLEALGEDIEAARAVARRADTKPQLTVHVDHDHVRRHPAHGRDMVLSDGAHIVVRPIEPADLDELELGFRRLGALSRYRRFRVPIDHLSRDEFAAAAEVDHKSEEALVALDAATGAGIGMAHYTRDPLDRSQAEFDCTVLDAWQHRGVGTVLLERLAARATAEGIERLTAHVLVGNEGAHRLLCRVADIVTERRDGGVLEVTAHLRRAAP
jgi:RimJ/RimL family protein N-acetyltransferase